MNDRFLLLQMLQRLKFARRDVKGGGLVGYYFKGKLDFIMNDI